MYKGFRIGVIMPMHDEADHLASAIARIPAYVDRVYAVDDGSRDGTWESLALISDHRLVRLKHDRNRGVGAATKTGYGAALQESMDLIAVMDGDGQMDGRDLCGLLDSAIAGADYVKGNRFENRGSIASMPRIRFAGNWLFSWLTRRAVSYSEPLDAQCGYTVLRRKALEEIDLTALYDRYGFPNDMFFAAHHANLRILSVPVRTIYGEEVSGINPLTAVPTILWLILRAWLANPARGSREQPVKRPVEIISEQGTE